MTLLLDRTSRLSVAIAILLAATFPAVAEEFSPLIGKLIRRFSGAAAPEEVKIDAPSDVLKW